MVEWYWLIVSFFIGLVAGLFLLSLLVANQDNGR